MSSSLSSEDNSSSINVLYQDSSSLSLSGDYGLVILVMRLIPIIIEETK